MRFIDVTESREHVIDVTPDEASALNALGRKLASTSKSWRPTEQDDIPNRSVISCTSDGSRWRLVVRNAVGVVRVNDLQITVAPKVPLNHFIFLLGFSTLAPRSIIDSIEVSGSVDLLELVGNWFTQSLESILQGDLIRDYSEHSDELSTVRGQLEPTATAQNFYSGRVKFGCRYDEFSTDTPLNRVLRSAAARVTAQSTFRDTLRRRSFRTLERLGPLPPIRQSDLLAQTDRRTAHYAGALTLAHLLLKSEARTIEHGHKEAWSFLIPTANAIEEGIRAILAENLTPQFVVVKRGLLLKPTRMTVNPDLVFDPGLVLVHVGAVGDIKYKLASAEWPRADLYQAVAFAAAYKAKIAVIISFGETSSSSLPAVPFGSIDVHNALWRFDQAPAEAASNLTAAIFRLLNRAA